eukprot:2351389-Prymnesium_polylepis.1
MNPAIARVASTQKGKRARARLAPPTAAELSRKATRASFCAVPLLCCPSTHAPRRGNYDAAQCCQLRRAPRAE